MPGCDAGHLLVAADGAAAEPAAVVNVRPSRGRTHGTAPATEAGHSPRSSRVRIPPPPPARRVLATAALALLLPAATAAPAGADGDRRKPVLLRSGLVGSTPAPVGPTLFGVTPGTAPWVLDNGRVRVERSGELELRVRGLVIPTAPANGTNPVPTLSASLVCDGVVVDTTEAVPFSTRGHARISTTVDVPGTCLAPAVLVHPNLVTGVYIAADG